MEESVLRETGTSVSSLTTEDASQTQDKDFSVYSRKYLPNDMSIFHKELSCRVYEALNLRLSQHK